MCTRAMPSEDMKRHRKHNLRERFELVKTLGQGTYGKVKLAIEKRTGIKYAIKSIRKTRISTEQDLLRVRREIDIMASLDHPHIIKVYEVFENRDKIILVLEYAVGGELYDFINDRKGLYEHEARRFFAQIAAAVRYMHANGIVHRDLKLENIVLDANANAKIADFGLANLYSGERLLRTFCGSPLYASPEIVNGTPYCGPEVDCWSLGVLLYTLVYGAMPFDGSNFKRLRQQITEGDYLEPGTPSDAAGLMRSLLCPDPVRRATVEDVWNHWWLTGGLSDSHDPSLTPPPPPSSSPPPLASDSDPLSDYDNNDSDCAASPPAQDPLDLCPDVIVHPSHPEPDQSVEDNQPDKRPEEPESPPPPIKGILKKPKSAEVILDPEEYKVHSGTVSGSVSPCCVPDSTAHETFIDVSPPASIIYGPAPPSHTPLEVDLSKKPKRGILKKRKYVGADSGCVLDEQLSNGLSELEAALNTATPPAPAQEPSTPPDRDSALYDLGDIEAVLDDMLATVTRDKPPPAQPPPPPPLPPSSGTQVVLRRSSRPLRGILKRVGRGSGDWDLSRRYSMGSQGSNSSADILDFSYDSAEGEYYMSEFLAPGNIDIGGPPAEAEEEDYGPPPPLPDTPPPPYVKPSVYELEREGPIHERLEQLNECLSNMEVMLKMNSPDNVEELDNHHNADSATGAEATPTEKIALVKEREAMEDNVFDLEEARDIYQQALDICKQWS